MAEAAYHNNSRDLFSEVRKMNAGKRSQPVSVDGKAENNDICQILVISKFDKLYNCVPCDADIFQKIKDKINQKVLNKNCCNFNVTVQDVVKAVQHLKLGKSGGEEGLYSDHLINAPHRLLVILCHIFNAMIIHGICLNSMLIDTMIPIPKVKRQIVCKSDNFRAITLSSIIGKVLDWIILIKDQNSLCTSD